MNIGKLAFAAPLILSGCATNAPLNIRAIALSPAEVAAPVPQRLAEARAQLAISNVALALDLFRKAEREQPGLTEALEGMAVCYEKMGRHDLSRRYFEQALAAEPGNARVLGKFAEMLERQGEAEQAAAVRAEVRWRAGGTAPTSERMAISLRIPEVGVGLTLNNEPVAVPRTQVSDRSLEVGSGSRLQRLSLGEVALVTKSSPKWARVKAPPTGQGQVRLLNATSEHGLAARTRSALLRAGWSQIVTGNSAKVRERSLILYSAEQVATARRLSRQLALPLAKDARPGRITVLLGRDAVGKRRLASL